MTTYLSDLEELHDIMDTLVFEDESTIFTEEHAIEVVETAFHLMEEFMNENPTAISEPNFHDNLLEEIKEIFYIQMEDHILDSDYIEDDMNDLLEDAFNIYITTFHPERSLKNDNDDDDDDKLSEIDEEETNIISLHSSLILLSLIKLYIMYLLTKRCSLYSNSTLVLIPAPIISNAYIEIFLLILLRLSICFNHVIDDVYEP